MTAAYFEDHPTDPEKVILRKPPLDQGADYERGFVDGMQYQMQSSVDKAVNRMAQTQEPKIGCVNHDCDKCKAQTQEPVAWIHNFIEGGISIGKRPADLNRHPDRWTALYKDPKPCPTCEALARTVMLDQTSHDITPPQRTWVDLTDEEIDNINYTSAHMLAREVLAKFKEKNT